MVAMGYRDEEDALRARNDALQDEVEQLRRERAQLDVQHARDLETARGVHPPALAPRGSQSRVALGLGVFVMLFSAGLGSAFFLIRSRPEPPPPPPVTTSFVVHATWHATVKSSVGTALTVGSLCQIDSALTYPPYGGPASSATVRVTCDTTVVYDSQDHTEIDASTLTFEDTKKPVAQHPEQRSIDLTYDEEGQRSRKKPTAAITTARGLAVFTRALPELRVELAITPGSDPVIYPAR